MNIETIKNTQVITDPNARNMLDDAAHDEQKHLLGMIELCQLTDIDIPALLSIRQHQLQKQLDDTIVQYEKAKINEDFGIPQNNCSETLAIDIDLIIERINFIEHICKN